MKNSQNINQYIHIGYPKCASSFLQMEVFLKDDRIKFHGIIRDPDEIKFFSKVKFSAIIYEFTHYVRGKKNTPPKSKDLLNLMGCGVNVISDEDFSTSDNINIEEKSLRIKKIFPLAKIIVVVRSPETLIRSFYHHCFRSGITNVNFNNWFEEELKNYNNSMILQTAHYGKCIKSFVKNFGQDNVCVLNLEDLKNNKNLFMSSLYKYMGLQYIKQENKITKRNESLPIGAIQFGIEYPFLWRFRFYIPRFVRRVIKFVFTKVEVKINTNNLNSKNRRYINDMYLNDIRYLESEFNIIFK